MSRIKLFLLVLGCCLVGSSSVWAELPLPPPLSLKVSNVSVTEGDSGLTPFTAEVSLSGTYPTVTVLVRVTATPGTADEKDYVFSETQVTLTTGGSPATVSGFIVGDTDPEGNQYFALYATPDPTSSHSVLGGYGTVFIMDDDEGFASQFHVEGAVLLEGDQGTSIAELSVKLEPASTNTVTVAYQTQDNSAKAGSDYLSVQGTLTFAPGEVLKTISVEILGDVDPEPNESFFVWLSDPSMALLGHSTADVTIVNDDPIVRATIADLVVDEGNEGVKKVPVTIAFDHPASGTSKVQISTVGVTAVADQDFRSFSRVLYPPAGATEMTFDIEVLSDVVPECDEGLFIRYSTLYMGDDTVKQAKVLLRNDDGPVGRCPDPFASVEPRPDAGLEAGPAPEPRFVDGGVTTPAPEPGAVDGGAISLQAPEPQTVDGGLGAKLDVPAATDVRPASVPIETEDARLEPDLAATSSSRDSGSSLQSSEKLVRRSGCSCLLGAGIAHGGLAPVLLLGILLFAIAKSRHR